jgi:hypothetical protein
MFRLRDGEAQKLIHDVLRLVVGPCSHQLDIARDNLVDRYLELRALHAADSMLDFESADIVSPPFGFSLVYRLIRLASRAVDGQTVHDPIFAPKPSWGRIGDHTGGTRRLSGFTVADHPTGTVALCVSQLGVWHGLYPVNPYPAAK